MASHRVRVSRKWNSLPNNNLSHLMYILLGKTHIKRVFFLVVGPLRFYPPYTNGLVVHATFLIFFFSLIIVWNGFWQFFFFFPIFGLKQPNFREKNVFLLSGQGGLPSLLSCVKIQKITNLLTLGQIKLYMGPVNKNPKKKFKILIFECAKLDFCKKKLLVQKKI